MTAEVVEQFDLTKVNIHLVNSMESAGKFLTWLGERRPTALAYDTETGGLESWKQPLRLVQFGDSRDGWAIPWERWGGLVLEVIDKYDGQWVAHNAKFDAQFVERHGGIVWPWARTDDTRLMAHVLDSSLATGLKPLANRLIDPRCSRGQDALSSAMTKQGWGWGDVPVDFQPYWFYGALDTVLTARLHEILSPQIAAGPRRAYDVEMAVQRIACRMEQRGARVDVAYCREQVDRLNEFVAQSKLWVQQTHRVNAASTVQVVKRLKELGQDLFKVTPGGNDALDVEVLESIIADPVSEEVRLLAETVLNIRKADKLAGSYFSNFVEMRDGDLLHCSINTSAAITGRMSITNPALQTLPRGPLVRNAFIASEGHALVMSDYEQVEMRLMAHFSQDPGLIAAFKSDEDFFVRLGKMIYNDPEFSKKDPRRTLIKNVAYGKGYGAGLGTMARSAKVPEDVMKPVKLDFETRFPGVDGLMKQIEYRAAERLAMEGEAYVVTPFGRKLRAEQGAAYRLTNYLIQGHAGEILKQALIHLDAAGLGPYLVLPVHDEVIFDIPLDLVEEAKPVIAECMSNLTEYAVPIVAGPEGPYERWGAKYEA